MRAAPGGFPLDRLVALAGALALWLGGARLAMGAGQPAPDPSLAAARVELARLVRRASPLTARVTVVHAPFDYMYARARVRGWALRVAVTDSSGCPMAALGDSLAARGWARENDYQADGPDGERAAWTTRRVLCVLDAHWDGGDDSDSTYVPAPGCTVTVWCVPRRADDAPPPQASGAGRASRRRGSCRS